MADPTKPAHPDEPRKGDSPFMPVVIAASIALLLILIGAAILIKYKEKKVLPPGDDAHPSSSLKAAPALPRFYSEPELYKLQPLAYAS